MPVVLVYHSYPSYRFPTGIPLGSPLGPYSCSRPHLYMVWPGFRPWSLVISLSTHASPLMGPPPHGRGGPRKSEPVGSRSGRSLGRGRAHGDGSTGPSRTSLSPGQQMLQAPRPAACSKSGMRLLLRDTARLYLAELGLHLVKSRSTCSNPRSTCSLTVDSSRYTRKGIESGVSLRSFLEVSRIVGRECCRLCLFWLRSSASHETLLIHTLSDLVGHAMRTYVDCNLVVPSSSCCTEAACLPRVRVFFF